MRKSNHIALRQLLREHADGLTPWQLAESTGLAKSSIIRALQGMPDAYIDRWIALGGQYAAVWCVVVPPPNCPHPTGLFKGAVK